mgnify:CR=1 FL=1
MTATSPPLFIYNRNIEWKPKKRRLTIERLEIENVE